MNIAVSDWVQGQTISGEFIFGYVEQVDLEQGVVKVYVVKSDNEDSAGRIALGKAHHFRKQAEWSPDEEDIRSLIDLALAAQDQAWFMELSGQLNDTVEGDSKARKWLWNNNGSRLSTYI
ncbi:IDEAL domain-containing protein [Paenibacillus catalpae]|uniref:IDEAL domain-containing protein n=1 Tax=Paenibacillus catalpae TaxID=1045775 RepID=UPI000B81FE6D|nr:IDEAL domain-containing protein [Paenibacillus catalpae]